MHLSPKLLSCSLSEGKETHQDERIQSSLSSIQRGTTISLTATRDPDSRTQALVEALCCVSGLSAESAAAADSACRLFHTLVARARQQWPLANALLRALQLIKSENKEYKVRWRISSCYLVLANQIDEPYFPSALRDTLKFFISSKMATLPVDVRDVVEKHPNLYT
ncbi:uncharacterized protein LOC124542089 [Vanessa cardui]|uniref:uncharacterized protein LOC124542089 n=1 Tax=Vanessa cardui TaxID=171605 RepID=UPI001F1420E4|nr:uncharacterized protein LOC124542089 [Vanessa cardui]